MHHERDAAAIRCVNCLQHEQTHRCQRDRLVAAAIFGRNIRDRIGRQKFIADADVVDRLALRKAGWANAIGTDRPNPTLTQHGNPPSGSP
jgi:hypothetical protein